MSEYDQLCRILDDGFKAPNQHLMIEAKGTELKTQRVQIDGTGRRNIVWTLYRFDLENKEFLPYFNRTDNAPNGLRKFCDYILLAEVSQKPYVMLIEMKRGGVRDAEKQLKASQTFIEYLYSSAERLHDDFGAEMFNRNNVSLRKIKLKECKSDKLTTKGGCVIDTSQEYISYNSVGRFPIARFL